MQNTVPQLIASWPLLIGAAGRLSDEDGRALSDLVREVRTVRRGEVLIGQDEPPRDAVMVVDGIAARCRTLVSGERQIAALMVPGDLSDGYPELGAYADCALLAMSLARVAFLPHSALHALADRNPRVGRCLRALAAREHAISREWLVNLGVRPADRRVAHLLCELAHRLTVVGPRHGQGVGLPLTQNDLSEATGMTVVHLNRVLKKLRGRGLIRVSAGLLNILDPARLAEFAGFSPRYLTGGEDEAGMGAADAGPTPQMAERAPTA